MQMLWRKVMHSPEDLCQVWWQDPEIGLWRVSQFPTKSCFRVTKKVVDQCGYSKQYKINTQWPISSAWIFLSNFSLKHKIKTVKSKLIQTSNGTKYWITKLTRKVWKCSFYTIDLCLKCTVRLPVIQAKLIKQPEIKQWRMTFQNLGD